MTAFDKIKAGLDDAIRHAQGRSTGAVVHQVPVEALDVAAIRRKVGMTQERFAASFGISRATLVKWEQKQRKPTGAAHTLLKVIDRHPEAVLDSLDG